MATGYTHPIKDGKPVTFEQFALSCSRAMGAAIMQRDESPDVEIRERTLDGHYEESVVRAASRVDDAIARPLTEWADLQDLSIREAEAHRMNYLAEQEKLRERYEAMLDHVRAWVPPTAEHFGLKKFMTEQLVSSIKFDCEGWVPTVPVRMSPDLYAANEIARLTKELGREVQHLAEERERVASQNAWVRALRDSLGRTDAQ